MDTTKSTGRNLFCKPRYEKHMDMASTHLNTYLLTIIDAVFSLGLLQMCVGEIPEILPQRYDRQPGAQPLHQSVAVVLGMSERIVSKRLTPITQGVIFTAGPTIHVNQIFLFVFLCQISVFSAGKMLWRGFHPQQLRRGIFLLQIMHEKRNFVFVFSKLTWLFEGVPCTQVRDHDIGTL